MLLVLISCRTSFCQQRITLVFSANKFSQHIKFVKSNLPNCSNENHYDDERDVKYR